ncbi:NUDIX domain-containing protein [Candidatus Woesearchaeota archaeon]|nr:NUDIX domain-containing protein [Candidatus Woesearchaeota archaeon]
MKKGVDFTGVCIVFFCHDGNGKFLMGKRSEKCRDDWHCWDIGGGGLRFGERVEEAVRREIKEEYCTDCRKIEFLGFRDVHRVHEGEKTHWVALDFKVEVDPEKAGTGEPERQADVQWFTLDNYPEKCHSQWPEFLRLHENKLRE